MLNLMLDSNWGADIRKYLASVLPDAQLTDVIVTPEYQPLLLMQSWHAMAGFAFSNGDLAKSYEVLYRGFKTYYSAHEDQYGLLDLAFVFCVRPDAPGLDHFSSSIETDVYFCRKYVIRLITPSSMALSQLPFLPLSRLPEQPLRPPSAQTLLQQYGVPAELAEFLVVQQRRGPERIIADCIAERFGQPFDLTRSSAKQVAHRDRQGDAVRLQTVQIENFRAYRKRQLFSLGTDVTVLYGPNGFGKTSFFDAIDFVITGGIGRLESPRQPAFAKVARHLDAQSEDAVVSLTFARNGNTHEMSRSVNDPNHPVLDGVRTSRRDILLELTAGPIVADERLDHLVKLFRASHLFSQDQQELTKDFQDDCELPSEIVSRMLALEDYANAVNKVEHLHRAIERVVNDANKEVSTLIEGITADSRELDRLSERADASTSIAVLDIDIERLRSELIAMGVNANYAKPDVAVLRGWRAALEAQHSRSVAASKRLTALAKDVGELTRMRSELVLAEQEIAKKEVELKSKEEQRVAADRKVQHAEQRLTKIGAKRAQVQTNADVYKWIRNTQPTYALILGREQQLNAESQHISAELTQLVATKESAVAELSSAEAAGEAIAERIKACRVSLAEADNLRRAVPTWQAGHLEIGM